METVAIVRPALVLGAWTLVMLVWMVATRVPAMSRAQLDPQRAADTSRLRDLLPEVQSVANNYNHLLEQPTLFYATVAMIALLGAVDGVHVACAWAYVGVRVVHSLVQATIDRVMLRFTLFLLSSAALAVMIVRALVGTLGA